MDLDCIGLDWLKACKMWTEDDEMAWLDLLTAPACPCQRLCIYLAVSTYLKNQLQAEVDVMKHET